MHARLGGKRQARAPPGTGTGTPSSGYPHRSLAPIPVRHASVDTATQRPTALQGDTPRDREETPRQRENSQLAGRFRSVWQVMGSNHRRLSRRFYSPLAPPESPLLTCAYAVRGAFAGCRRPLCVRGCRVSGYVRSTDGGGPGHGRARTSPDGAEKATDGAEGSGYGRCARDRGRAPRRARRSGPAQDLRPLHRRPGHRRQPAHRRGPRQAVRLSREIR
jgi:hypothetical protein